MLRSGLDPFASLTKGQVLKAGTAGDTFTGQFAGLASPLEALTTVRLTSYNLLNLALGVGTVPEYFQDPTVYPFVWANAYRMSWDLPFILYVRVALGVTSTVGWDTVLCGNTGYVDFALLEYDPSHHIPASPPVVGLLGDLEVQYTWGRDTLILGPTGDLVSDSFNRLQMQPGHNKVLPYLDLIGLNTGIGPYGRSGPVLDRLGAGYLPNFDWVPGAMFNQGYDANVGSGPDLVNGETYSAACLRETLFRAKHQVASAGFRFPFYGPDWASILNLAAFLDPTDRFFLSALAGSLNYDFSFTGTLCRVVRSNQWGVPQTVSQNM